MATYRKRNGKWQAQVRSAGQPPRSKSFLSKSNAMKWVRLVELDMDAGGAGNLDATGVPIAPDIATETPQDVLEQTTIADLIKRYKKDVSPGKRGYASEAIRLDVFVKYAWAELSLAHITTQTFASFRDKRLKKVRPATVVRELGLLRAIFETAMNEWDVPLKANPLIKVKKPKQPEARNRRLLAGELERLLNECNSDWLKIGILLAIETGVRRGELLNIHCRDVDLTAGTLFIPHTKTGFARCIPLTPKAQDMLSDRIKELKSKPNAQVFSANANTFRLAWERCRARVAKNYAAITNLRFHDLRHEAISRFFEMGLSVPEVSLISGHRDPRMLFRYTHLKAEDIVHKLRKIEHKSDDNAPQRK